MFEKFKKYFHKPSKETRSLDSARPTRFVNWSQKESYSKINVDIRKDLLKSQARCRGLAENDPIVRSYLNLVEKNVIGKAGFELQMQLKKSPDELDEKLNNDIEWLWYEFGQRMNGTLTLDGNLRTFRFR